MPDLTNVTSNITVTTTEAVIPNTVIASYEQMTTECAEDIDALCPVLLNSDGKWIASDANDAARVGCYGLATQKRKAGDSLTAIRRGEMCGSDLSAVGFGKPIYVSNTVGTLADAAGGTSLLVGYVGVSNTTGPGAVKDKFLAVECTAPYTI